MAWLKNAWWSKPVFWGLYTYVLTIAIAFYANARLDPYQDKPENHQTRSDHPGMTVLADSKPFALPLLIALGGVPTIMQLFTASRTRRKAKLELLKRHLRMVRNRSFPESDGMSIKVRVSLFETSEDGAELDCVYRTDDTKPQLAWPTSRNEGFVVRAFKSQVRLAVDELKPDDPEDLKRYLEQSWATPEIHAARSWNGPAMLAIPVIVRPGAHPAAVFLIEAIGTKLADSRIHAWDADMCRMLMEDLP